MQTIRTPREWLNAAIDARTLAAYLTDPVAKRVMEETADECEAVAQIAGALIAGETKPD